MKKTKWQAYVLKHMDGYGRSGDISVNKEPIFTEADTLEEAIANLTKQAEKFYHLETMNGVEISVPREVK